MSNSAKITRQMKKFSIQGFYFDITIYVAAICYSDPISAVQTNKQLLRKKRMWAKFQIAISKAEGLVSVYTDIWSSFWVVKLYGKLNIPCSRYKKLFGVKINSIN